jgi:perosamine synthetase
MDEVMAIAREHNLAVIEDCAHALFATDGERTVGTIGTAGVFSLQSSKHVTTGEGGFLVTNDPYIHEQVQTMLRFGAVPPRLSWNFRTTELTAAVAGVQFGRADAYVDEDRRSGRLYAEVAAGHPALLHPAGDGQRTHSYHIWAATYRGDTLGVELDTFRQLCAEEQVSASFGYLKVPIYLQPQFSLANGFGADVWRDAGYCPYRRGYCPQAEATMPRLMLITVSTSSYEFHQRNAEALGRAMARVR